MGYNVGAVKNTMIYNFSIAGDNLKKNTVESKKYALGRLKNSKDDLLLLFKELRNQGYSSALNFENSGTEMLKKTGISPESLHLAKIKIYLILGQEEEDNNTQKRYYIEVVKTANELLLKKGEFVEEYYLPDILLGGRVDTEDIIELVLPIYREYLVGVKKESVTAEKISQFIDALPAHIASKDMA